MSINFYDHSITTSGTITSPSGNFTTLVVNGTSVSNFNSSVSGLLPTIANSGDNRVLTSTGSTLGINAESNLTFDGSLLNVVGSGSFSSQTVFASGTAAAPGISIVGDTDTGIGQLSANGTNSLSIMTSGVERVTINSVGNIGIGSSADSASKLLIAGTFTSTSNNCLPLAVGGTIPSGATNSVQLFRSAVSTEASSFTIATLNHFFAAGPSLGAGSAIANQIAFRANSTLTGATNNYGFYSDIASGTGRWNFYANGTADNYFAGKVGIGSASTAATYGGLLRIGPMSSSSLLSDGGLEFVNAASSNGWGWRIANLDAGAGSVPLVFQNRSNSTSWSEILRITEGGNVGIGTSSPSTKLDVFGTAGGGATIRINDGTQDLRLYTSTGIGVVGTISNSSLGFHTNNTERMRITSAGNVGIGTSSPAAGAVVVSRSASTGAVADIPAIVLTNRNSTNATFVAGGVFSNTFRDVADPHYSAGMWFVRSPFSSNNSSSGDIVFGTGENVVQSAFPTERMRITSGGNVGIGTTNPTEKLHVRGAGARAYIYNTTTDAVVLIQGLTPASPWLGAGKSAVQIDVDGWGGFAWQTDVTSGAKLFKLINNAGYGASESTFITVNNSGNVGINNTPTTVLEVGTLGKTPVVTANAACFWGANLATASTGNANLQILSTDNQAADLGGTLGLGGAYNTTQSISFAVIAGRKTNSTSNNAGGYMQFFTRNQGGQVLSEGMRLTDETYLLVGYTTSNGAYKLQVNSQIYATNATVATSDARFKTNVESLTDATAVIEALRPVAFDFIPQQERNFATERQVGLIAQEAQSALAGTDYANSVVAQCGDHLGLAYEKLVPVLIKALQESNARIAALEDRLNHA